MYKRQDKYNASQDEYQLVVEFRQSVDSDMTTALAANQGPDIVYGSGPAFVMPLVEAGKLENLDEYSKQYGWEDKILQPYYESGTVNGNLYSFCLLYTSHRRYPFCQTDCERGERRTGSGPVSYTHLITVP